MTSSSSRVVDLSIDYDFFIREDPTWDLGHLDADDRFTHMLWQLRYRSIDLHRETDPARYADFLPTAKVLFAQLERSGLKLGPEGLRKFCVADSHMAAAAFFRSQRVAADYLVNLDAHHDAFSPADEPLSCENWLSHVLAHTERTRAQMKVVQVYPMWKDPTDDDAPCANLPCERWRTFRLPEEAIIRNVFLCRSSAWVPPHHDAAFNEFACALNALSRSPLRRPSLRIRPAPSIEQADAWRQEPRRSAQHSEAASVL